ncbi:MAG: CAP domain-containing protein [Nitratireductor sp.]
MTFKDITTPQNDDRRMTRRSLMGFGLKAGMGAGSFMLLGGCTNSIDRTLSTKSVLMPMRSNGSDNASNFANSDLKTLDTKATPAIKFDVADGFMKLNQIRQQNGLVGFSKDARLQKAAQDYANLMAAKGKYGHEIGPGTQFKKRINAAGYDNSSGENLGVGYDSIEKALQGWMDSDGHKKNMLKPHYQLAGLGYAYNNSGKNPQYTHLWVLIMGFNDAPTS